MSSVHRVFVKPEVRILAKQRDRSLKCLKIRLMEWKHTLMFDTPVMNQHSLVWDW